MRRKYFLLGHQGSPLISNPGDRVVTNTATPNAALTLLLPPSHETYTWLLDTQRKTLTELDVHCMPALQTNKPRASLARVYPQVYPSVEPRPPDNALLPAGKRGVAVGHVDLG